MPPPPIHTQNGTTRLGGGGVISFLKHDSRFSFDVLRQKAEQQLN